jgi:hypothetical protein
MKTAMKKLEFENGEHKTINVLSLNMDKIRQDLEDLSGLRFGSGDYLSQAFGMAQTWMLKHSLKEEHSEKAMYVALFVAAGHFQDEFGGLIVATEDDSKVLLYVPCKEGDYVVNVDDFFHSILFDMDFDYDNNMVMPVKTIRNKKDLHAELNKALQCENYEYASKLRDKIKKEKKFKKNNN